MIKPERKDNIIKGVYGGKYTPLKLPRDVYLHNGQALEYSMASGMGGDLITFEASSPDAILYSKFRDNIYVFSGAKTHDQLKRMGEAIFTEDGFKRPFADFKRQASGIFDQYNKRWLKTEQQMAIRLARAGKKWNETLANKDLFPLLEYVTVGDDLVRPEHEELDGIVLPVSDPFWQLYFPPNDWGCRCDVRAVSDEAAINRPPSEIEPPDPLFRFNPGVTGFIFDERHPYFSRVKDRFKPRIKSGFGQDPPAVKRVLPKKKNEPKRRAQKVKPKIKHKYFEGDVPAEFLNLRIKYDTKVRTLKSSRQAYYSYRYDRNGNQTDRTLFFGTARFPKGTHRAKSAMYHELGHATHDQQGWIKDSPKIGQAPPPPHPIVKRYFDKAKKLIGNTGTQLANKEILDQFKQEGRFSTSYRGREGVKKLRSEWWEKNKEKYPDYDYDDVLEMSGTYADIIQALTGAKVGFGHKIGYAQNLTNNYMEFFAHAYDARYAGNPMLKYINKDLHNLMVEMVDKIDATL